MPERPDALLIFLIAWLQFIAETLAAIIVGIGLVVVVYHAARNMLTTHQRSYWWTRVQLSKYLVLALEFQLAADILATSVAPDWAALGKLATIAAIRTALNYFLGGEMRDIEQHEAKALPQAT